MDSPFSRVAACRDGVLLDTNVLLLLLIGSVNEDLIEKCSRLRAYSARDFRLLRLLLKDAHGFVVTPHIATETWNLAENSLTGEYGKQFKDLFARFLENARETWVRVSLLAAEDYFKRLGVADTGVARIRRKRPIVVTDDSHLTRQLEKQGALVVNFTHLRVWE
ncbi:MAG: hypothetical protein HUU21_32240 [Polyangiaceae bacterium]|nr:hypothetical protein [Polyangiaceae bacterium]